MALSFLLPCSFEIFTAISASLPERICLNLRLFFFESFWWIEFSLKTLLAAICSESLNLTIIPSAIVSLEFSSQENSL